MTYISMKYLECKILQRQCFVFNKGFFSGWLLKWKPVSTQKSEPFKNMEYLLVTNKKKVFMKFLQSSCISQKTNFSSQVISATFTSILNESSVEDRFKKIQKEIDKFNEKLADVFCEVFDKLQVFYFLNSPQYFFDTSVHYLCHPVLLCNKNESKFLKKNETIRGKLLELISGDTSPPKELVQTRNPDLERMKTDLGPLRDLFEGDDSLIISKKDIESDILEQLEYAINNPVPDSVIYETLLSAKSIDFEKMDSKFFDCYYRAVMKLDKNSSEYIEHKNYLFYLIETAVVRKTHHKHLILFLLTYANYVKLDKEEYFENIQKISGIFNIRNIRRNSNYTGEKFTTDEKFSMLKARIMMRKNSVGFANIIKDLVIENPALVEESIEYLYLFLEGLGSSNFHIERHKFWPFVRSFIRELSVLKNADKWKEADFFHHLNVAKVLALYGIYPRPLLNSLWEKCNQGTLSDDREILNVMVVLNQAIYALHPSFNKSFLNENTLSLIEAKLEENCKELQELNKFTSSVKLSLENEIYELDCILKDCYTKQGLKINLLVALNENNEPFSFTKFLNVFKKIYIEDILLPTDYQLVLIILIESKNHSRENFCMLDSEVQLKLKSLQAMGYMTVPIVQGKWDDINKTERGAHIWKQIRDRNNCKIPDHLLEKAREPLMFD